MTKLGITNGKTDATDNALRNGISVFTVSHATGIATNNEKKVTRIINRKVRPKTGSAFACKTISSKSGPASAERAIK